MKLFSKPEILISIGVFVTLVAILFGLDPSSTGDSGDSITHYLFSRYSFSHPELFFNHWAKPLFVLLSSPFAQFGFKGLIVFNILCVTLTGLLTYYVAKDLKLKNPLFAFTFLLFAPFYFQMIFSGLTEYLFGLFLILGVFLYQRKQIIPALIIISFLPLIRTEGLLFIAIFGIFTLIEYNWKSALYVLSGQIFYTILGMVFYKDALWLINEIPYANIGSPYGHGGPFDFVHKLNYVIEKPIYVFFLLGSFVTLVSFLKFATKEKSIQLFLILGSFSFFFIAHSIFWWLGIFNSMGLPRVLIAVIPLVSVLAVAGVESITKRITNTSIRVSFLSLSFIVIALLPFTSRPEGIVFDSHLFEVADNKMIDEDVVPFIKETYPDYANVRVYFSHPYISMALDIDYFDKTTHLELQHLKDGNIPPSAIVIWDNNFALIESGITLEYLMTHQQLILIATFKKMIDDKEVVFAVFGAE